jgi:lysyl-tRNA synthetase class 2
LDIPLYLRIAPETYLKRCIVGGYERVYEFAKCFRNEGIDPSHLQEFTMLEYYVAYWNYLDNMNFTEKLIKHVLKKLLGTLQVETLDRDGNVQVINFDGKWPRLKFVDLIKGDSGIDIMQHYGDAKSLLAEIRSKGIQIEKADKMGYGNLCDALYKKVSRPKLIQPCFVIKHPVDTKPLARRNDKDHRIADTFQLLVNTWEVLNAYSELVDPLDQRDRLEKQVAARDAGDDEAMPMDEDYILAMEHGMPPISGWGMGIDRMVALLTKQDNLKDTVLFPLMKPLK